MKWRALALAGRTLIDQLIADASRSSGSANGIVRSLRALRDRCEPAAIPSIIGFLADRDQRVVMEALATLNALYTHVPLTHLPTLDERIRADSLWATPLEPADVGQSTRIWSSHSRKILR